MNAGTLFYLYFVRVSVAILGTRFIETPEVSGVRSIVHVVPFLDFLLLRFNSKVEEPFDQLNGDAAPVHINISSSEDL